MKILVLSDVHSNLGALDAVLADAGSFDRIWSLGDIVGYGPEPNECIARLREFEHVAIAGNHDWGVLGRLDLDDFNADARQANLWNRQQLVSESFEYLEAALEKLVVEGVTLAHGSPRHPIWEYLMYPSVVRSNLAHFDTQLCFVGHTHVPLIFRCTPEADRCEALSPKEKGVFEIVKDRLIINPGSVGQPRDGDPRAAYMLYDTKRNVVEHRRVSYNIGETQEKMRAAGLPPRGIARLEYGW